jgi:hypothetical protein
MYNGIYENIDLKIYGVEIQVEYDWIVKPGAKPDTIRFRYSGAKTRLDKEGNLIVNMKSAQLVHQKPISYQIIDGKKVPVESAFRQTGKETYGFNVGQYDRNHELVIDPMVAITYSTYLGGSGEDNWKGGKGSIAVNSTGIFVAGYTRSTNFPTANCTQCSNNGNDDLFVSKLLPDGTGLIYSTYIGGSSLDRCYDMALSSNGSVYVAGCTYSADFPAGGSLSGSRDGVLAVLNSSGGLQCGWYIGGSNLDWAYAVSVDSSGDAYTVGYTDSNTDFPVTTGAYQTTYGGGTWDAFVCKINCSSGIVYASYLGGSNADAGYDITLDVPTSSTPGIFICGFTESSNFPTEMTIFSHSGSKDAFISVLDNTLATLYYSTLLGGSGAETATGIDLDGNFNIYLTGDTDSIDFPVKNAIQDTRGGNHSQALKDAFVTQIDISTLNIGFSTYLGGSDDDIGWRIVAEYWPIGIVHLVGETISTDFPTVNAFQSQNAGEGDVFVSKIDSNGTNLAFSTYLGGSLNDFRGGIARYGNDPVYVTGGTQSSDFPVHNPFQATKAGNTDAFVTRYVFSNCNPVLQTDKSIINFTVNSNGYYTSPQTFLVQNIGCGSMEWGITENSPYIYCQMQYVTIDSLPLNFGVVEVSLSNPSMIPIGEHQAQITVKGILGTNVTPKTVYVNIESKSAGSPPSPSECPIGAMNSPAPGAVVFGSIPISGWALDDIEVESVSVKFEKGGNIVHTGTAVFVEGSRPDIATSHPDYPLCTRAGWGYLLQSYFIGTGTYTVRAKATDIEGNTTEIGTQTLYVTISQSPFGAICKPSRSETASGSLYDIEGWALTPLPNSIANVKLYIDGVYKGLTTSLESCNFCTNVNTQFPGFNNSSAPCFKFQFNTIGYDNGMHTLHCIATDNTYMNPSNLGSEYIYFDIWNTGSINSVNLHSSSHTPHINVKPQRHYSVSELSSIPLDDTQPVRVKKDYNKNEAPKIHLPDRRGYINVTLKELERVVINLNSPERTPGATPSKNRTKLPGIDIPNRKPNSMLTDFCGYIVAGDQLWPLPLGSTLDAKKGIFYWQTEACHFGDYQLVFVGKRGSEYDQVKKIISVKVVSKFNGLNK